MNQQPATEQPPADAGGTASPAPGKALWRGLAALAAVATLAAFYSLYWEFAAGQLRDGIRAWAAERGRQGIRVEYAGLAVDGYPFRLHVVIAAPSLERRSGARPWSWRGPAMALTARPWRPGRVTVSAAGRHALTMTLGDGVAAYDIRAAALTLKTRFGGDGLRRARLAMRGLEVRDGLGELLRLSAAEAWLRRPGVAVGGSRPGLDVAAEADDVQLRLENLPGLAKTTAKSRLEASLIGRPPKALDRAALADWRDAGGVVEVRTLDFRHGTLAVRGDGTLALDGDLQPVGAFAARVRGYDGLIDQLAAAGVVRPGPAALAKAALGVLAREQGPDGNEIRVPLSIQNRRLYLGPVPLLRFKALDWN